MLAVVLGWVKAAAAPHADSRLAITYAIFDPANAVQLPRGLAPA